MSLNDVGTIAWSATGNYFNTKDTGISRGSAGIVAIGDGTQGDSSGELDCQTLRVAGTGAGISVIDRSAPTGWVVYSQGGSFGIYSDALSQNTLTVDANGCVLISTATVTSNDPALLVSQTWNNGADGFTGLQLNFTNTASDTLNDLPFDVVVSGTHVFNVNGYGTVTFAGNMTTGSSSFLLIGATGQIEMQGGTVTANTPMISITQEWNNAAAKFDAIFVDITNAASLSTSLLLDLQVGGSTAFGIDAFGNITVADTIGCNNLNTFPNNGRIGVAINYDGDQTGASSPMIQGIQTWNNAATVFTGVLFDVTNTASNIASKLFDFQVGGVSQFNLTLLNGLTLNIGNQFILNTGINDIVVECASLRPFSGTTDIGSNASNQFRNAWLTNALLINTLVDDGVNGIQCHKPALIAQGTITAAQPAFSVTSTWNNVVTTFTALLFNVTNTASAGNSMLLDLQVNASTIFKVDYLGQLSTVNNAFIGGEVVAIGQNLTSYKDATPSFAVSYGMYSFASSVTTSVANFDFYNGTTWNNVAQYNATSWYFNVALQYGVATGGGTNSALLGSNCPATHFTAPYAWINVLAPDGTPCVQPIWQL